MLFLPPLQTPCLVLMLQLASAEQDARSSTVVEETAPSSGRKVFRMKEVADGVRKKACAYFLQLRKQKLSSKNATNATVKKFCELAGSKDPYHLLMTWQKRYSGLLCDIACVSGYGRHGSSQFVFATLSDWETVLQWIILQTHSPPPTVNRGHQTLDIKSR